MTQTLIQALGRGRLWASLVYKVNFRKGRLHRETLIQKKKKRKEKSLFRACDTIIKGSACRRHQWAVSACKGTLHQA